MRFQAQSAEQTAVMLKANNPIAGKRLLR